jgi:hypothetical protein
METDEKNDTASECKFGVMGIQEEPHVNAD